MAEIVESGVLIRDVETKNIMTYYVFGISCSSLTFLVVV